MWQISYSQEVKSYFIDNEPYCFDLLVQIEALQYTPGGIPPEGLTPIDDPDEPDLYLWLVLGHVVYLQGSIKDRRWHVVTVKPLE